MAVTQEQLDEFHRFASKKLSNGGGELSWEQLIGLWQLENPTAQERAEVNAAIREGLADVEAGRVQPFEEFEAEMREEFNIPPDA
jgi:hypothetical protein